MPIRLTLLLSEVLIFSFSFSKSPPLISHGMLVVELNVILLYLRVVSTQTLKMPVLGGVASKTCPYPSRRAKNALGQIGFRAPQGPRPNRPKEHTRALAIYAALIKGVSRAVPFIHRGLPGLTTMTSGRRGRFCQWKS
jgi:hypothetical protein